MINNRPRRIHLTKGAESRYEEGRAGSPITPGQLIAIADDDSGDYVPHSTADGKASPIFALEDALQGNTIDDNYNTGDLVRMIIAVSGDHILAILPPGSNVKIGDLLGSDGAGYVKPSTTGAFAAALEDRDASSSDADMEDRRIRIRIL